MALELDEEGAEHGFGIDELLLPGAAAPAAVAPEPLGEEEGWIGIGKFGAEDIDQDTLLRRIGALVLAEVPEIDIPTGSMHGNGINSVFILD